MEVFCLEEFKSEYDKLKKNNSYRDLEKIIIDFFFGKTPADFFKTGSRINGTDEVPFIKIRIKGRGGWRFYYLLLVKNDKLYLMFLHPKTGSKGSGNITTSFEKEIYHTILKEIAANNLYTVTLNKDSLVFTHNLIQESKEIADIPIATESVQFKEQEGSSE